jgi:uncharacterized protein (TIGR02145 family)
MKRQNSNIQKSLIFCKSFLINVSFSGLILIIFVFHACNNDDVEPWPKIENDSITDIDGNVYLTVKIGEQWWMAENLKVKRYRNGDSLIYVGPPKDAIFGFDSARWSTISDLGAYCALDAYDTSKVNYDGKVFGFLYNGYVILDHRNIAPLGWHVPSDEEWRILEMTLGMSSGEANDVNWRGDIEGNKLKIQSSWVNPYDKYSIWGTNESGFSAIGSSCKMFDGKESSPGLGYMGFWWTSSKEGNNLWYRYLDYNKSGIFRYFGSKNYGFSIRCVRD